MEIAKPKIALASIQMALNKLILPKVVFVLGKHVYRGGEDSWDLIYPLPSKFD